MRSRLAAFCLLLVAPAAAQEFRALIEGLVKDPTGANIPFARVTLFDQDTSISRTVESDGTGHYIFQFVVPGTYSITAEAPGFRTLVRDGLTVRTDNRVHLDLPLALGAQADTVLVNSDVSLVQHDTSALGNVVRASAIDSLPLKGHSSLLLFNLAVGVVSNRYGEDSRISNTVQNVLYSVNGSPPASGDVSVDGVSNTVNVNRGTNLSSWVPPVDAVSEFKLQTGTLPAEYGRAAGSIMNIVIKSGTNELHASAYDYFKNSALDSNFFFSNAAGLPLRHYTSNTFGASLDGPVYLPRIYDGHSKTFFFVNYEGLREENPAGYTSNVPTTLMREGDFSQVSKPIYDPFSVRLSDGVPVRDPFPGNLIPLAAQDPVARQIMQYYPHSDYAGPQRSSPWVQRWVYSGEWPRNYNSFVTKIDHVTPRHQMFLRVNKGGAELDYPGQFDGIASPGSNVIRRPFFGVAADDTYTITPHIVLDVRLGYTGGREIDRPWSAGFDLTSLGFPSSYAAMVQSSAFPTVNVSNFQSLGGSPSIDQSGHTWSLQPSLSIAHGSDLFKAGGEIRLIRGTFYRNNAPSGAFTFSSADSSGPRADTPDPTSGFALASMLLGYGAGSIDWQQQVGIQNLYYAAYLEDDRHITSHLSLNLGLRYEYESPRTERDNRTTVGFAYRSPSPLAVPGLDLTGGLLYAGVNGQPRGIYRPNRANFAPRIGFAYSFSQNTAVRGGASINYIPVVGSVQPTGYTVTTPWTSTTDGITPLYRLSNPFPNGPLPRTGNSAGMLSLLGAPISFIDPSDRTPSFYSWEFNVQHEFPSRTLVEIGYVGSRGVHIIGGPTDYATTVTGEVDQLSPAYLSLGPALLQPVSNPFYGVIPTGPLSGPTVPRQQLLRPYPQFTDISRIYPAYGNSSYHSVQVKLQKRLKGGIRALVGYTVSKNISDIAIPQDATNRRSDRALSEFDVPQRLTTTASWDIPFAARHRVFRRWELSTFDTFQSGFPLAFTLAQPTIYAAGAQQRPNVAGKPLAGISGSINSRLERYFNTAAFAQPADFTFGSLGPRTGAVRGPGMNNWNARIAREFHLTEQSSLAFRIAAFNLLNHPVFSAPNTNYGGSSFGRIFNQANFGRQLEISAKFLR